MSSDSQSVTDFSVSYISINESKKAEELAHLLIQQKMAACVQILPQMTSVYSWKGVTETQTELLIIVKSRTSKLKDMTDFVVKHHPYDVCEVVSVPVSLLSVPFFVLILLCRKTDHVCKPRVSQMDGRTTASGLTVDGQALIFVFCMK